MSFNNSHPWSASRWAGEPVLWVTTVYGLLSIVHSVVGVVYLSFSKSELKSDSSILYQLLIPVIASRRRRRSNPHPREEIAFPTLRSTTLRSTTLRSWQAWQAWQAGQAGQALRSQGQCWMSLRGAQRRSNPHPREEVAFPTLRSGHALRSQ